MKRRIKKSNWLPWVLLLYAVLMSLYFGPGLIKEGYAVKFWISVGVEIVVIISLFIALRHKEGLENKRKSEEIETTKEKG